MSNAETIATIKSQTLDIIADITANPKPNYSVDGMSVSWGDYLTQLQATIKWCDEQAGAEEPFEVQSRAYT